MSRVIGVSIDGVTEWHAVNIGPTDHNTLCGIDADDPTIGHNGTVLPPHGTKINCTLCKTIYLRFIQAGFKKTDFET